MQPMHASQCQEPGQSGLRPLIEIHAPCLKAVPATSSGYIVDGQSQIIVTQEPAKHPNRPLLPFGIPGHQSGLEAGVNHGACLQRLLVKPCSMVPPLVPADVPQGAEVTVPSLDLQQPLQSLHAQVQ